jgi:hypothetical protein
MIRPSILVGIKELSQNRKCHSERGEESPFPPSQTLALLRACPELAGLRQASRRGDSFEIVSKLSSIARQVFHEARKFKKQKSKIKIADPLVLLRYLDLFGTDNLLLYRTLC